ncbi:MAG: hypothetical protein V1495_01270 [Pseudomonadota bacterium]
MRRSILPLIVVSLLSLASAEPTPTPDPTPNAQVEALFSKAGSLRDAGKLDAAIELYERIIREHPLATYSSESEMAPVLYKNSAASGIQFLKCRKRRAEDFAAATPEEFGRLIRKAIEKRDVAGLERMASCQFNLGASNTDWAWDVLPQNVMPTILQIGERLDWTTPQLSDPNSLSYVDVKVREKKRDGVKSAPATYAFSLVKNSLKGWSWRGFSSNDRAAVTRLDDRCADAMFKPCKK